MKKEKRCSKCGKVIKCFTPKVVIPESFKTYHAKCYFSSKGTKRKLVLLLRKIFD